MAMRYELLSYKYLVDRVRRDGSIPDYQFDPDNLREWIAEAVRSLEAKGQYELKTVQLRYENYRAKIPTDYAGYERTCTTFYRDFDRLVFPKKEGVAHLRYYVMPVDNEGIPLAIDEPNTLGYYSWYLLEKLFYLGQLPPTYVLQDIRQRQSGYLLEARTTLNWPTNPNSRKFKRR